MLQLASPISVGVMAKNDGFQKYIEAGSVLGHVTRARAEDLVKELVNAGEIQKSQAQRWVDELVDIGSKTMESLAATVRSEVKRQLKAVGIKSAPDLAGQVAEILKKSADTGKAASLGVSMAGSTVVGEATKRAKNIAGRATKKAAPAKKAPAKKAATAKKAAPAKKAGAKKTPAKKAGAAKKSAAKRP